MSIIHVVFSGICNDVLLKGRPYGGVLFLYKKSISPYVEACCIRLSASIRHIYICNVYMSCDSSTNSNLEEYSEMLSVISNFCDTHNVENRVIGGDLNTDMSSTKSGNLISLQNFMDEENMFSVFKQTINVAYTYKGANNTTSLIDHFIVSEDVTMLASDYFTLDSVYYFYDHVPLYMLLKCDVDTVTTKSVKAPTRSPVWGLASCHNIIAEKC